MRKVNWVSAVCALIISLSVLASGGCDRTPVAATAIVGQWQPTRDAARIRSDASRAAAALLTFAENGKFSADNLAGDLLVNEPNASQRIFSGRGSWKITDDRGQTRIFVEFTSLSPNAGTSVPYGAWLQYAGSGRDAALYFYVGDPDSGIRFEFTRKGVAGS